MHFCSGKSVPSIVGGNLLPHYRTEAQHYIVMLNIKKPATAGFL